MCIYTVNKQNFLKIKKNPQGGCATPPNVPKLGVSSVRDTAKTNKDCRMSCYIQVEYSIFFHCNLSLYYDHRKIISKNIL